MCRPHNGQILILESINRQQKMKRYLSHLLIALSLLVSFSLSTAAQSPGSLEYYVKYGREYFEAGNFESAATYFQQGVSMYPKNAEMHLYLGQAYLKMKKTAEARVAFQKAVELDPSLEKQVAKLVGGQTGPTSGQQNTDTKSPMTSRADNAPIKIGDDVEAKLYTSEQWVSGTVVAARDQYGDGRAFVYRVRYRGVNNSWAEGEFYPGRVRAVTKASSSQNSGTAAGNALFYGDYVCYPSSFTGGFGDPKGTISLRAGGTYTFRGSSGRYKYNAATGEITWTSGYLSADNNTTRFRRNRTTAQIDITFKTAKGNLDWGCGTNLK